MIIADIQFPAYELLDLARRARGDIHLIEGVLLGAAIPLSLLPPVPTAWRPTILRALIVTIVIWVAVMLFRTRVDERRERVHAAQVLQGARMQRILAAVETFVLEQRKNGRVCPNEVSLHDLVAVGSLRLEEISQFRGLEAVFATHADPTRPQHYVGRVRLRSGGSVALMVDGSVVMLAPLDSHPTSPIEDNPDQPLDLPGPL